MRTPHKIRSAEILIGFEAEFWFFDGVPVLVPGWGLVRLVADFLEEHLNTRVIAGRNGHLKVRPPRRAWTVVEESDMPQHFAEEIPDYLLRGGVEIVSPPLPIEQFGGAFLKVAQFVQTYGLTDENCGVHLNISIREIDRLDPLKLVPMLEDEKLLCHFGRSHNHKIRSIRMQLAKNAATSSRYLSASSRQDRLGALRSVLPVGKDYSLNLKPWLDGWGYLEFRQCGGRRWFDACQQIVAAAKYLCVMVGIACDLALERPRYFAAEQAMRKRVARIGKAAVNSDGDQGSREGEDDASV